MGLVQNNQHNYQHVELTANTNNLVSVVGVDPSVALQLQQQAAISEIHAANITAAATEEVARERVNAASAQQAAVRVQAEAQNVVGAARAEVSEAQKQRQLAENAAMKTSEEANRAVASANAAVGQTLAEGRAAVAAARSDADGARAMVQVAEAQRDAAIRQQEVASGAVRDRIAQLEAKLEKARAEAERERANAASSRSPQGHRPPRPGHRAQESYNISTPPGSRERSQSLSRQSPAASQSAHFRPQSDDMPVGADAALLQALGELQGSVGKTLTSISERLEAVAVLASHRSTRKGSGTSPSRPRRMNAREAGGRAPAATVANTNTEEPHRQDASLQRHHVEGLNSLRPHRLVLLLGETGHQGGAGILQTQLQLLRRSSVSANSVAQ